MLQEAIDAVQEFHDSVKIAPAQKMRQSYLQHLELTRAHQHMRYASSVLESSLSEADDQRALRAHLILEECGELLRAMQHGNLVETLDGMADLIYVVCGTAAQFGLPLSEAFRRVHESNMTKSIARDPRCRDKGDSFKRVDLTDLVENY